MMTLPGIMDRLAHLRGSEAMLQAEVGEPIGGWKCCDESWVFGVSRLKDVWVGKVRRFLFILI